MFLEQDELRPKHKKSSTSKHSKQLSVLFASVAVIFLIMYLGYQQYQLNQQVVYTQAHLTDSSTQQITELSDKIDTLQSQLEKANKKIHSYTDTADKATRLQRAVNKINKTLKISNQDNAKYTKSLQERENLMNQIATKIDKYTDTLTELSNTYVKLEQELQRNSDTQSANLTTFSNKINKQYKVIESNLTSMLNMSNRDIAENAASIADIDKGRAITNKKLLLVQQEIESLSVQRR
jgi:DNA repair ATPase RecN